jgi:hypothetical protein
MSDFDIVYYSNISELEDAINLIDKDVFQIYENDHIPTLCKGYTTWDKKFEKCTWYRAPMFDSTEPLKEVMHDSFDSFDSVARELKQNANAKVFSYDYPKRHLVGFAVHPTRELHYLPYELLDGKINNLEEYTLSLVKT